MHAYTGWILIKAQLFPVGERGWIRQRDGERWETERESREGKVSLRGRQIKGKKWDVKVNWPRRTKKDKASLCQLSVSLFYMIPAGVVHAANIFGYQGSFHFVQTNPSGALIIYSNFFFSIGSFVLKVFRSSIRETINKKCFLAVFIWTKFFLTLSAIQMGSVTRQPKGGLKSSVKRKPYPPCPHQMFPLLPIYCRCKQLCNAFW